MGALRGVAVIALVVSLVGAGAAGARSGAAGDGAAGVNSGAPGDGAAGASRAANDWAGRGELPAAASKPRGTRALLYPPATEVGLDPPEIRLAQGTPASLYFPGEPLDGRGELHFVTTPRLLGLRVAERTVFVFGTRAARPGDEGLVTITLAGGRPLTFRVRVVAEDAPADVGVEVTLAAAEGPPAACRAPMQRLRDELAECRETDGDRALELVAGLFLAAGEGGEVLAVRPTHRRDKQRRIYVEVVDAVRLYDHTFLRVRIENRDGGGPAWSPGEVRLSVIGPGPRRRALPTVTAWSHPAVPVGGSLLAVIALETPALAVGTTMRLALHERDGLRHVVLEDLAL